MEKLPHRYTVHASAAVEGTVDIDSPGLPRIVAAPPREFDGPGDCWSPETLLTAAVANCFILSFRAVAAASKVTWQSVRCDVTGTLDRVDRITRFTAIHLDVALTIGTGDDDNAARRAIQKAEEICFITNSLKADASLDVAILRT